MVNAGVECRMAGKPKRKFAAASGPRSPLGRKAWLDAGRQALIEEGTAGVEINKLARRLEVTRGGFYWFFKSRQQLLNELLRYWVDTSTFLFERIVHGHGNDGMREYLALIALWVDEKEYDPRWDAAVRDWARTSKTVLKAVRAVDEKRIAVLEQIFVHIGYRGTDAHVRARVTYYHQVGYYAMGVRETRQQRLDLLPFYARVLTGREV